MVASFSSRGTALVGVLWLALGCSSNEDTQANGGPAFNDVPSELAKAVCEAFESCGAALSRAYLGSEDCLIRTERALRDGDWPALAAALEAGRVVYKPERAPACFAAVRSAGCSALTGGLPEACGDALLGTRATGESCNVDGECGVDSFCAAEAECPGACAPKLPQGGDCAGDYACERGLICGPAGKCVAPIAVGADCSEGGVPCTSGTFCFGAGASELGRCVGDADLFTTSEGQSCTLETGPLCKEGLSCLAESDGNATCHAEFAPGEACQFGFPDPCSAGDYCALNADGNGTCTPLPAAGQPCADAFGPSCQPLARCVAGVCRNLQRLGGSCDNASMCYSERCADEVCAPTDACNRR